MCESAIQKLFPTTSMIFILSITIILYKRLLPLETRSSWNCCVNKQRMFCNYLVVFGRCFSEQIKYFSLVEGRRCCYFVCTIDCCLLKNVFCARDACNFVTMTFFLSVHLWERETGNTNTINRIARRGSDIPNRQTQFY